MNWLIAALACWRLTSLLLKENGPFDVFVHWRAFIGGIRGLEALTTCVWCLSVWVAVPVALIAYTEYWPVLAPFALSAAAILIEERHGG